MRNFPLRIVLPFGLLGLWLLILGISLGSTLWQRSQLEFAQARVKLIDETARLARVAERGLRHAPDLVEADVTHSGTDKKVVAVAVLDPTGRVIFANRLAWKGKPANEVIPGFDPERFDQTIHGRLPALTADPRSLHPSAMMAYTPPSSGSAVRNLENGAVYIKYDLAETQRQASAHEIQSRLPDFFAASILMLLLVWVLHRHVSQPLTALKQVSRRIAEGD